ncbi:sensor histidine kinase [Belliella marina]|uniref:Sensor histidine kinase n=1 Tax=Belliella marina TaxID=1644146 RepID=A0ABW4VK01_9BACT
MRTRLHPQPVCLIFVFTFLFLLVHQGQFLYAQSPTRAQEEFDKLAKAYHSNKISARQYFVKADSLTNQLLTEGKYFEPQELVNLLESYEKIAWSKDEYGHARSNYFICFLNNARLFEKNGASMYYAEKAAREYEKSRGTHSLLEAQQKCYIYMEQRNYGKVISVFNQEQEHLQKLPVLLKNNLIDYPSGIDAIYILSPAITSFIKTNDTTAIYQTAQLAEEIGTALVEKYPINDFHMLYNDFFQLEIKHAIALFEKDQSKVGTLLDGMDSLRTVYRDLSTDFISSNLIPWRIDHYFNLNNPDSVEYYIRLYESLPLFEKSTPAKITENKSKLHLLRGNIAEAYSLLADAIERERDVQALLNEEVDELLYAYTAAEHSDIAFQRAEKEKQQRTVWLFAISLAAVLIVLGIYLMMRYRSRKARQQIEELNNAANIQIIALEEMKHEAVREEQRRLGQDLHDGLSSSIASIKHQLEVLSLDTEDPILKKKLAAMQSQITNAYEIARDKSHEWFNTDGGQQGQTFEQQIKLLIDSALPDSHYQKDIHIDEGALQHIPIDTRIALFRIIQEAITNIIKHAKANRVSILLYEEADSLMLAIKDNGTGLKNKKSALGSSSMGLKSIKRRVQYLNGKMEINFGSKGTELAISIP